MSENPETSAAPTTAPPTSEERMYAFFAESIERVGLILRDMDRDKRRGAIDLRRFYQHAYLTALDHPLIRRSKRPEAAAAASADRAVAALMSRLGLLDDLTHHVAIRGDEAQEGYAEQLADIGATLVRAGVLTEEQLGQHGVRYAVRERFATRPPAARKVAKGKRKPAARGTRR